MERPAASARKSNIIIVEYTHVDGQRTGCHRDRPTLGRRYIVANDCTADGQPAGGEVNGAASLRLIAVDDAVTDRQTGAIARRVQEDGAAKVVHARFTVGQGYVVYCDQVRRAGEGNVKYTPLLLPGPLMV